MRFDDRLATVLEQPANTPLERAVRWRQLVELVAGSGGDSSDPLFSQALAAIRAGRDGVDEPVRAAAARAIAGMAPPAPLIAAFAEDVAAVSSPVLLAADLAPGEWAMVIASASLETLSLLSAVRPDVVRPAADAAEVAEAPIAAGGEQSPAAPPTEPAPAPAAAEPPADAAQSEPPPPPASTAVAPAERLFRWECGPSGQIDWVEGIPRGALIGRSIAPTAADEGVDPAVRQAFADRAPFRQAVLHVAGEGSASGDWRISGFPAFDRVDGRFAGYRGIGTRTSDAAAPAAAAKPDPDAMRELVHELKTPLNAIIGFAEIIDGQYLGPAHRRYRQRAAEILRQAWALLDAVEDLDLAAKLKSDRYQPDVPVPIDDLVEEVVGQLEQRAGSRGITLQARGDGRAGAPPVDKRLARRLVSRLAMALIDSALPGETITVRGEWVAVLPMVRLTLPNALRGVGEERLLDPALGLDLGATRALGAGFTFRLVRSLATAAGGSLALSDGEIVLTLPPLLRG